MKANVTHIKFVDDTDGIAEERSQRGEEDRDNPGYAAYFAPGHRVFLAIRKSDDTSANDLPDAEYIKIGLGLQEEINYALDAHFGGDNAGLDTSKEYRFSLYAGCDGCACSPGFIVPQQFGHRPRTRYLAFVQVKIDDDEDATIPRNLDRVNKILKETDLPGYNCLNDERLYSFNVAYRAIANEVFAAARAVADLDETYSLGGDVADVVRGSLARERRALVRLANAYRFARGDN